MASRKSRITVARARENQTKAKRRRKTSNIKQKQLKQMYKAVSKRRNGWYETYSKVNNTYIQGKRGKCTRVIKIGDITDPNDYTEDNGEGTETVDFLKPKA